MKKRKSITPYEDLTVKQQRFIDFYDGNATQAAEKAGYKKEGTLRKALLDGKGRWADGCIYSILKEEWKNPRILALANTLRCETQEE